MDLFIFKKIVGYAAMPLPLLVFIIFLGIFWTARNKKGMAIFSQLLGLILLLTITNPNISHRLLSPLEQQHKQYDLSVPIKTIVILGCGHTNDGMLPITAQLASCSMYRLAEGIRIYKANPGSRIIASGYGGTEPFSNAFMMKEVAIAMGIPENHIQILEYPKDTEQEAQAVSSIVSSSSFALVTSASHMYRAIQVFSTAGLDPIPAPTGHLAQDPSRADWWEYFPSAQNIRMIERWWYETMGAWWLAIKS